MVFVRGGSVGAPMEFCISIWKQRRYHPKSAVDYYLYRLCPLADTFHNIAERVLRLFVEKRERSRGPFQLCITVINVYNIRG